MHIRAVLRGWVELLRWQKPSGRLILLIPAGWALWLLPSGPPPAPLVGLVVLGGLAVSGAGCVANDLWDRHLDPLVERTRNRPLASGRVSVASAALLLVLALLAALLVVALLPERGRGLCLALAIATLPPVLLYPSAKRWFAFPQLVLAFCWGFAVLIPWAAATGGLWGEGGGGWPLLLVWAATLLWTFGFDTVYAMADRRDDAAVGLRSSALSLGAAAPTAVAICYGLTALFLAIAASLQGVSWPFWPLWGFAAITMQREALLLRGEPATSTFAAHFRHQVLLGGLLLLALVTGRP
ncbi:4-hydroxybenzoate polyprenyltransferase [Synechococcus sp. CS-1325]|uniref:4-hydroxybenzoate polyprenyltransferase n=1 Tax=unclassified Synechococcus TaxID=2626047 RepID=UPI000DB77E0A|nr:MULTISPECIES: 4-hydroxybenzoate polyprenyltransferase [unclassified Synechococcus]MCT0198805.1 4-hydroxybenzoate polyprenyltransferase [Synechococcus sp. CS-1325]MCT0231432.1 4-hydroxybenzoate polyprenyltransferase [Synechococcus sp. CS-1324]PZV00534.1 MAG: 4-hydroxybenzoate octaprenyltransferase [Cyanobium sp.]PZV03247.1 MAG: 4-hydroxybenzoate octaprenyltransferase [Cyanobium sp.]